MNGNGRMIELLERIAEDIGEMRSDMREVKVQLVGVNQRLDQTNARIDQTNQRFDHALRFMGSYHADHEQRLQALEAQVFTKKT